MESGCERTYQCRERGSQFCSQEGKGNAAQETQQRRDSHEETNLLMGRFQFWELLSWRTDQGLVDTRSFAKADGDAVEAKDGEVEHCKADSGKAKPMLCKELESSD